MSVLIPCLRCRASAAVDDNAAQATCPTCDFTLPPPAAAAWMVAREGMQPFGPYTIAQLRSYLSAGQVLPTDSLWHPGAPAWVKASELAALAPDGAGAAPVQPRAQEQHPQPYEQHGPYTPVAAGPEGPGFLLHIKRAFGWNLRTMEVSPAERERLIARSVDEENARQYLCWRRSILLVVAGPTLLSALLALIGSIYNGWSGFSGFGILVELLRLLALLALPATAIAAAMTWEKHRLSRKILLIGWLVAFLTPLILALFPITWRIDMNAVNRALSGGANAAAMQQFFSYLFAIAAAASAYVTLMPAVLSLIPGVLRACLRIKALLPESILPGWFLVAATPLYILLFLVVFTTVNQVAGDALLMLGVLALLCAPLLYLFNAGHFTRPLQTEQEAARIGLIQNIALGITALGVLLLFIYAFEASLFGKSLIGLSERTSHIRPWDPNLFQIPLDYLVRSLFTTVVVADLFMLMNLSLWRQTKAFTATAEAESYDRLMSEIEEAGGARV